jgi:hypothetical protein
VAINLQLAKFPCPKRLEQFAFAAQASLDRRLVEELATTRSDADVRRWRCSGYERQGLADPAHGHSQTHSCQRPFFFALLPFIPLIPNVWQLGALVFLFGASGGFMDVSMNAAAARVETEAGRPYMSSFHGMWSLGGFAGAGVATLLLKLVGSSLQALLAALIFFEDVSPNPLYPS